MKKLVTLILFALMGFNGYGQMLSAIYSYAQGGPVPKGTINAPIMKLKIVVGALPVTLDSISFNNAGCTNYLGDVDAQRLFYTDSNDIFSSTYPFFLPLNYPNQRFYTSQPLNPGDNYFWLAYDIRFSAISGDCVGAIFDSLYFNTGLVYDPLYEPSPLSCLEIGNPTLAIENINAKPGFTLHPNPASNFIIIKKASSDHHKMNVKIIDAIGKALLTEEAVNDFDGATINTMTIRKGIYVAAIKCDGQTTFIRFIKN